MNKLQASFIALLTLWAGTSQAALIDRGGGLIYDDVLNITWLQDANYAKTSNYDADGKMTWNDARSWASQLFYGGFDDWRLPTMIDTDGMDADTLGGDGCNGTNFVGTDCGHNVQTYDAATGTVYSELAYMYYVNLELKSLYYLDGSVRDDWGIFGNGTAYVNGNTSNNQNNVGLVRNLQASDYWINLDYSKIANNAWYFGMYDGRQSYTLYNLELAAWAVRDGDVAPTITPSPIPEPSTLALLLIAGLSFLGLRQIKR